MTCRGCEFLSKDMNDNVCGFPSGHTGAFVSKDWNDKPHWCPLGKLSNLTEDWRSGLFLLYHNAGLPIPSRLHPVREYQRELPRGYK